MTGNTEFEYWASIACEAESAIDKLVKRYETAMHEPGDRWQKILAEIKRQEKTRDHADAMIDRLAA